MSDDILGYPWLYMKGNLPEPLAPGEPCALAVGPRGASPGLHFGNVPGYTSLTEEEFDSMWPKALAWFHGRTSHLDCKASRAKFRPSQAEWATFRLIVQFWFRVMQKCCQKDMDTVSYQEHLETVLLGDALDSELMAMINRNISCFHIGMLTSSAAKLSEEATYNSGAMQKTILDAALAKLEMFRALLKADWANVKQLLMGVAGVARGCPREKAGQIGRGQVEPKR